MFNQLIGRSRPESPPQTGVSFGRRGALLAALSSLLAVAPFVGSQGQPAKQGLKPGGVTLLDTVTAHNKPIQFLAFTNGGKTLVSVSNDYSNTLREQEIKLWDVAT